VGDLDSTNTCGLAGEAPLPAGGGNSGHGAEVGASPTASPSAAAQPSDDAPVCQQPADDASGAQSPADPMAQAAPFQGMYDGANTNVNASSNGGANGGNGGAPNAPANAGNGGAPSASANAGDGGAANDGPSTPATPPAAATPGASPAPPATGPTGLGICKKTETVLGQPVDNQGNVYPPGAQPNESYNKDGSSTTTDGKTGQVYSQPLTPTDPNASSMPTAQEDTPEMQQQEAADKAKSDCQQWFLNDPDASRTPMGKWCQPGALPINGPNPKAWNPPAPEVEVD
jgi:hypothetical protein